MEYDPDWTPPDPERSTPSEKEAFRWAKLLVRCGYTAKVGIFAGKTYGVAVDYDPNKPENEQIFLRSHMQWHEFLDRNLFFKQNSKAIMWDRYLPSKADRIEKEIHKWIKEYKEVDC